MKNILVIILIIISIQASAQFSVGLKTGVSLSDYTVKTKYNKSNKGGLAAGLVLMNTIGTNIGVQADILYVQKGYNHQICNQCYDKFTSTFIEVPVNLRYSFYLPKISSKLANLKAHASGGIYFSRWLNAKYETKIFDDKISENYVFTGEKRADFGPNFGAGLEYALFTGSLSLDFRYSLGVVDMSPPGSTNAQKNRSAIISLGYLKSF
ncbi:MAG TPA: porin family protein [Cyclobacteriaceae bacterium]|nr:porin family protein [Cyclobacteriaceae bacterium]